jgi:hypothetical protein
VREAAKEVYDKLENHENSLVHPKNDEKFDREFYSKNSY